MIITFIQGHFLSVNESVVWKDMNGLTNLYSPACVDSVFFTWWVCMYVHVCVSLWQNVVLHTPTVAGTTTETIFSTLPGVYICVSVQDAVTKFYVCIWDQNEFREECGLSKAAGSRGAGSQKGSLATSFMPLAHILAPGQHPQCQISVFGAMEHMKWAKWVWRNG